MDQLERLVTSLRLTNTEKSSFRSTNIYPSSRELNSPNNDHLLENITKGPYKNVDHYLNTHFRLLRADFLKPLTEDLSKYLLKSNKKVLNIEIHKVRFVRPGVERRNTNCLALQIIEGVTSENLDAKNNSKRFMNGSLLIFSADNFQNIVCGIVADRKNLKYRNLLVTFNNHRALKIGRDYQMIECNTFFGPYYHVLNVIQNIKPSNFPMQKYLIEVDTSVGMPKYMRGIKPRIVDPSLNKSQLEAINAALSQELVIIQGPPGTGKTYLGFKIAKQILGMSDLWYNDSPMLVISATNHALDQFLEGISRFTKDILRCGNQSKSSKMQEYTIPKCRKRFYSTVKGAKEKWKNMPIILEYYRIQNEIKKIGAQLDNISSTNPTLIFSFHELANSGYTDDLMRYFREKDTAHMIVWLLEEDGTMGEVPYDQLISRTKQRRLLADSILPRLSWDKSNGYMLSVSTMRNAIEKLKGKISKIANKLETSEIEGRKTSNRLKDELKQLTVIDNYMHHKLKYLKHCLRTFQNTTIERTNVSNEPFVIPVRVRWQLYKHWLTKYESYLKVEIDDLIEEYKPIAEEFFNVQDGIDIAIMKKMKIIGMTTTKAAMMHSEIAKLRCPIVIVEEAAQVLEAHVIPVLTKHCQHLILLGDHKQLQPSTADYQIRTCYNLDVSLFERLVKNDFQCHTLNVQHRMRPEISSLIRPSIYATLYDHRSVRMLPDVQGMRKNVFFISHRNPEHASGATSKNNLHEAKFLIRLAVYLLQNGYQPEHITILAAYLGQVDALMQEQKNISDIYQQVKTVKITSVDNFQGEENKIVLLSLVRNNEANNIGFLSTKNRVCVALSRAKEGLYVMCNMSQLTAKSALWREINVALVAQNAVGEYLPLQCAGNGSLTLVRETKDFDRLLSRCKSKSKHTNQDACRLDDLEHYYLRERGRYWDWNLIRYNLL